MNWTTILLFLAVGSNAALFGKRGCYTSSCDECKEQYAMEECSSEPYANGGCDGDPAYGGLRRAPSLPGTRILLTRL